MWGHDLQILQHPAAVLPQSNWEYPLPSAEYFTFFNKKVDILCRRLRWAQMGSGGLRWAQMGSDGLRVVCSWVVVWCGPVKGLWPVWGPGELWVRGCQVKVAFRRWFVSFVRDLPGRWRQAMKLLLLSALAVAMAQDFEDFASETRDVTHFVKKSTTFCNMVQWKERWCSCWLRQLVYIDWILQNSFFSGGRSFGGCWSRRLFQSGLMVSHQLRLVATVEGIMHRVHKRTYCIHKRSSMGVWHSILYRTTGQPQ